MSNNLEQHTTEYALLPYLEQYGLRQPPFAFNSTDKFYFEFAALTQQLNLIQHLIQSTSLILLVLGKNGAGKTTFLNKLRITAPENIHSIPLDANDLQGNDALLKAIASHCHLPTDCGRVALLHLLDEEAYNLVRQDQIPLISIDNAHLLNKNTLEALLQLSSGTGEHNTPWHILLCSEPEIHALLSEYGLNTSNDTRIHISELPALDTIETAGYIQQRMTAAGLDGPLPLNENQIQQIYMASNGIPGEINNHAHQALMALSPAISSKETEQIEQTKETPAPPIIEQAPAIEEMQPDIIELLSEAEPETGLKKRKIPWFGFLFGMLAIIIFASVLIFQERINTLFSNDDIITKPNRIEPLLLPDKKVSALAKPRILMEEKNENSLIIPPNTLPNSASIESTLSDEQSPSTELQAAHIPKQTLDTSKSAAPTHTTDTVQQQSDIKAEVPHTPQENAATGPTGSETTKPSTPEQAEPKIVNPPIAKPDAAEAAMDPPHQPVTAHGSAWLLEQAPSLFTLQILGTNDKNKIQDHFSVHPPGKETAHYQIQRNEKDWHIIVQGLFTETDSAQEAIALLPEEIRQQKPWVRKLSWIHKDIKSIKATAKSPDKTSTPPVDIPDIYDAKKLLGQDASTYTLQLLASQQHENTTKFIQIHKLDPKKAFIYRAQRKQQQLYILLYGNFPDAGSAKRAITELPAPLRKLKPWERPLRQIQQEIRTQPR